MNKYELFSFADSSALADAAACAWLKELEKAVNADAPYCVALSGGRIARQFFAAAASLAQNHLDLFRNVHFFWGDERCVPPTDKESNYALAYETLLAPLGIPEIQNHRVRGEDAPEVAAVRAAEDLCRIAPGRAQDQPVLDLIFLGMGEDGHVASLFPGEPEATRASRAVFRPVIAVKPPPNRITLGYAVIAAARQVCVLTSGEGKEEALRESLAAEGQTPLARVLGLRERTRIFSDIAL